MLLPASIPEKKIRRPYNLNTPRTSKSCSNSTKKFIKHIRKHAAWKLTVNDFLSFTSIDKSNLHKNDIEIKPAEVIS